MSQNEQQKVASLGNPPSQGNPIPQIVRRGFSELTATTPQVAKVAKVFNWKPEKLLVRVQRALPALFEQHIYLAVAGNVRIHPESLAKILEVYRGSKPLSEGDLERRPLGKNVVSNSFGDFSDFFEACINLVKVVTKEYEAFGITMHFAAEIVSAYGPGQPEQVIEMIDTNLDECCEYFHVKSGSYSRRLRTCTWIFLKEVLPELRERGIPNVLDPSELFSHQSFQRRFLEESSDERYLETEIRTLLQGEL